MWRKAESIVGSFMLRSGGSASAIFFWMVSSGIGEASNLYYRVCESGVNAGSDLSNPFVLSVRSNTGTASGKFTEQSYFSAQSESCDDSVSRSNQSTALPHKNFIIV